jgi:hypothetical protein
MAILEGLSVPKRATMLLRPGKKETSYFDVNYLKMVLLRSAKLMKRGPGSELCGNVLALHEVPRQMIHQKRMRKSCNK